jgi:hypothetical protein
MKRRRDEWHTLIGVTLTSRCLTSSLVVDDAERMADQSEFILQLLLQGKPRFQPGSR